MKNILKVLHLEDSPRDFELIRESLIEAGFELEMHCSESEKEFVNMLRNNKYDVILSDFNLPEFDGFAALRLVMKVCPDTPFIIVSGRLSLEQAVDIIKQGATDFVLKDNLERLSQAIHRAIEDSQINRLKISEEELKISEQQNKSMIEAIPDFIFRLTKDGVFLYYKATDENDLFANIAVGKNIIQVLPKDILQPVMNCMQKAIDTEKTQKLEYHLDLPSYGTQFFEARFSKCGNNEILVLAHNITERITSDKKIKEQELQIINALLEGQEKERKRFSQELHDGLGQLLAGLKMNITALKDDVLLEHQETYNQVAKIASEALEEYRSISHDLVSPKLKKEGFKEVVLLIVQRLEATTKIKIFCEIDVLNNRLPLTVETELFRITQELINNAVKYAKADRIDIRLKKEKQKIVFSIQDNGVGFDIESSNLDNRGIGLGNIYTRAKSIGGEFVIESALGKGTKGTITLDV